MLLDYELFTVVNAKVSELVTNYFNNYGVELDMITTQTDKYENSRDESITIGIGSSKGIKTKEYYFNVFNDETTNEFKVADKYFNEPVSYYEHIGTAVGGGYITYHLDIQPLRRIINVYKVVYSYPQQKPDLNEPHFEKIETINLKDSKFMKKVV